MEAVLFLSVGRAKQTNTSSNPGAKNQATLFIGDKLTGGFNLHSEKFNYL